MGWLCRRPVLERVSVFASRDVSQTPARVTVSQRQGAWQLVAAGSVGSSILNMCGEI